MKTKLIIVISVLSLTLVGAGTTDALLNDIELSENNIFRAGSLDIQIGWEESLNDELVEIQSPVDDPAPIFNLTNIQRGDSGEATIEIQNNANPGYLWFTANQTSDEENFPEEEAEEPVVCGPIQQFGDTYDAVRKTGSDTEEITYEVERKSNISVKFEDAEEQLGEDGEEQTDTFDITVKGESDETVFITTKAGRVVGTARLEGEGDSTLDTSGEFSIKIENIEDKEDETVYTVSVTSDSAEDTPALSFVKFQFCEPIERRPYWQIDFSQGAKHVPDSEELSETLVMSALSDSEQDDEDELNPSYLNKDRLPEEVELKQERFFIQNHTSTVKFEVEEGEEANLSHSSYTMPGPFKGSLDEEMDEQKLFDSENRIFGPGEHEFTIDIPPNTIYEGIDIDSTEPGSGETVCPDPNPDRGELGENLLFTVWHDDGDNVLENETVIFNGTAHQLGEFLNEEGKIIDYDPETSGIQPVPGNNRKFIGFKWKLPDNTGCEVHTDSKTFDFKFELRQSRHNGNPFLKTLFFGDKEISKQNLFKAGNFTHNQTNTVSEEEQTTDENQKSVKEENKTQESNDELVSYWPLDRDSYAVKDVAGDHDGQNHGAVRNVSGKVNNSFKFDGSDHIEVEASEDYMTDQGTVAFWVKMEDKSSNWMFSRDEDGCENDCGHLSIAYDSFIADDKLGVRLQKDEEDHILVENDSIENFSSGVWNHVAVSFGGENGMKLYINGRVHDSENQNGGIAGNNLSIDLGEHYDGEHGLKGKMDEIRFYDYVINSSEIEKLNQTEISQTG